MIDKILHTIRNTIKQKQKLLNFELTESTSIIDLNVNNLYLRFGKFGSQNCIYITNVYTSDTS